MAIKKFKVNASKQAKSIKKRIIASELLSGVDKLPERGKVITKTIKGDPVVIVGIGDNKYMYKSYLNKASATGDVQFIRNLIKKGEVPANAVKNLGYKLYTSSGSVDSACGKKSVKSGKVAASKKFTAKVSKSIKAARNSKTMVELVLQGNYGYGWDDLVSYDNTPEGRKEMKDDLKTYQQEEGGRASFRTVERRVANPDYKAPADRFRVTPYKLGFKYKDGDTVKFTDMEEAIEYATSQDKDVVLKDVVTGYNVQISNDTSFGMSGQERDNFNKRNIRNFRQVVGESETVESSVSAKKRFGVKASKSAKKRVAAAKGYWADDINAESYRKILKALDDYLIANYDGKTIGGVEIGVSKLRSVKNGIGSKIEIMFYCPDYNNDTKLEIITAPELRSKFLGRVSAAPFKFDDEFMIRQSGCKQVVVDKINEIADMLSNGSIEGVCGKKRTVKASHSAKIRKAIKASGIQNDIVMYFNGDNVYQGSVYDLADAVENLCYDDEVNAKFQEWCNQFGDPFDFDGSPIDTARVFTDIIIHEAEEAPETENGGSQFYEDGNGILDFEIFYVDEYSIDGAKSIKCSSSDNYNDLDEAMRFRVCNYYDTKFRDLAECKVFDDFDEAVDYAHECLGKGPTTIEDYYVGTVEINPDEYWDNFDGEFWCTPELADFRDEVWKSMGIGASKSIKCSDADGIADEWEDIREIANQDPYEYDGYDDGDIVEYVDQYFNRFNDVWLYADYVDYNGPDDWSVSASLGSDSVGSDFNYFLEEHYPELYNTLNETRYTEPDDPADRIAYDLLDVITPNDFFIEFYPNNNQWSAPQIDIDTNDKQLKAQLEEARSAYEANRIDSYKAIQDGLGEFLANGITASTDIKAALVKKSEADFISGLASMLFMTIPAEDMDAVKYQNNTSRKSALNQLEHLIDYSLVMPEIYDRSTAISTNDDPYEFEDYFISLLHNRLLDMILNNETPYSYKSTNSDSADIKAANSLNLNAKPNYTDWVLRGYKFDGEDVTTLRIDFQDDVKKAVMDMFSDPDIETVDLYKIPTEQETTGVFEDEEYFSTITRDDINASTDITAALNKKSDINDEQYNQALADEVADMLRADGFEDIEVSVAPEAISFFINDEVMFVQPTNMITPNMADIYDDCTELFNAVKEATTDKMWKLYDEENKAMRDTWEDPDINDPDYATRAVTLSRKAKGKDISAAEETIDIDDLDYISGDDEQEDWGYGFDSYGEPVTESMVEELERIAQETLDKSEIHNIDEYADLHNFNYYASIPYIQESFDITFTYVADVYELSKRGLLNADGIFTTVAPYNIHFNVRCENGEVEYAECTDVDVNDGYVKDVELTNFNLDALVQFATDLVNPVAMDIYNATTNI